MKNLIAPFVSILVLAGCSQVPPPVVDTREADAKAIRDAEAKQLSDFSAKEKDLDKITSFWADDASVFFPDMPVLSGQAAIKPAIKEMMSDPNFSMTFAATKVEVAKSSDYGYSQGAYTMTSTDPKTKKVLTEKGKYVTVYKKQADGSWKAVADINNADAPAAPAK
jgi:ketosteroid isomerase-like protein